MQPGAICAFVFQPARSIDCSHSERSLLHRLFEKSNFLKERCNVGKKTKPDDTLAIKSSDCTIRSSSLLSDIHPTQHTILLANCLMALFKFKNYKCCIYYVDYNSAADSRTSSGS